MWCTSNPDRIKPAAELKQGLGVRVGHGAEIANADEAFRQHMQEETPDELVGSECHFAFRVGVAVIPPVKPDLVVIKRNQSMIGDGDPVGVAAQVTEHLFGPTEGRFDIDDPVVGMDAADQGAKAPWEFEELNGSGKAEFVVVERGLESIDEFATEYVAKDPNG